MKPYTTEDTKQDQVRRMFDGIAPDYDRLNHLMSFGVDRLWRRSLVGMVAADRPASILDLATGTGDLAVALARKCPDARITGADLSPGMLDIARKKLEEKGLSERVSLIVASAGELPFVDGEFDAVTIAFGIRNFADIPASLAELHRVLKPGGRLYILEFSRPRGGLFSRLFRFYFHRVVPWVGGLVSGDRDAYKYLPSSVDEFPGCAGFMEMLARAGFASRLGIPFTDGVAYIYKSVKP